MKILGLTGGIACGKSTVSLTLKRLGAVIVDGDQISHELTGPSGAALPDIRAVFGNNVFHADGTLNRKALGNAVFGHPEALKALDDLMQPQILQVILDRISECRASGVKVCVLDMPLLYEKGLDTLCDTVWCVFLPEEEQIRRLMARDGLDKQAALLRIASMMPSAEKAARAETVIDTSGTIEETASKLPALYRALSGED